ncbi:MAG: hypothetical protein IS632_07595, partial [Thaumarchaeota archaeon]|nr:hypothetical protein [Nitrososphaerota archaeon]
MAPSKPIFVPIKQPALFLLPTALALLLVPFVAVAPVPAYALDSFEALDGARDIAITSTADKTYALVSSLANDAVQIIDVTDPANPLPVAALFDGQDGFVLTDVSDMAIVAIGDKTYALVASFAGAVHIIDVTDPNVPLPVASVFD